jgi:hypothetical protein
VLTPFLVNRLDHFAECLADRLRRVCRGLTNTVGHGQCCASPSVAIASWMESTAVTLVPVSLAALCVKTPVGESNPVS